MNNQSDTSSPNRLAPFHTSPISLGFFAEKQKAYRQIHCIECGLPILEITDRVVYATDAEAPIEAYSHNGGANLMFEKLCHRHTCKQRYRVEVAYAL